MRKHNSLFNQVCQYINSRPIGTVFTNDNLYNNVDEAPSNWKRREKDLNYTTRFYRYWLMKAGVLEKFGKKTWKIVAHVPDHVESNHIWGVKSRNPYQLWHISHESTQINSDKITIYVIIDKHIEPIEVLKTQVGALLSTGSYFEDEMDAWYFLSIGTGIAVESLKDTWKKTQDFANEIVEMDKSHLEQEEDEIIERLDGLLRIISLTDAENTKYMYGFNGEDGPLNKAKIASYLVVANDDVENESLKRLLQLKAGHKMPWTIFAEEIIESIENGDYYKEEVIPVVENVDEKIHTNIMLAMDNYKESVKNTSTGKFITFEDIRGNDVYYKDSKNNWCKGTIIGLQMSAFGDTTPVISNIHVKTSTGSTQWIDYKDAKFSKEEILKIVTESINSL
jgi:hypothetical protein